MSDVEEKVRELLEVLDEARSKTRLLRRVKEKFQKAYEALKRDIEGWLQDTYMPISVAIELGPEGREQDVVATFDFVTGTFSIYSGLPERAPRWMRKLAGVAYFFRNLETVVEKLRQAMKEHLNDTAKILEFLASAQTHEVYMRELAREVLEKLAE